MRSPSRHVWRTISSGGNYRQPFATTHAPLRHDRPVNGDKPGEGNSIDESVSGATSRAGASDRVPQIIDSPGRPFLHWAERAAFESLQAPVETAHQRETSDNAISGTGPPKQRPRFQSIEAKHGRADRQTLAGEEQNSVFDNDGPASFRLRPQFVDSTIPFDNLATSYADRLRAQGKTNMTITRHEAAIFKRLQPMIEPVQPVPDDTEAIPLQRSPKAPLSQLDSLLDDIKVRQRIRRQQRLGIPQGRHDRRSTQSLKSSLNRSSSGCSAPEKALQEEEEIHSQRLDWARVRQSSFLNIRQDLNAAETDFRVIQIFRSSVLGFVSNIDFGPRIPVVRGLPEHIDRRLIGARRPIKPLEVVSTFFSILLQSTASNLATRFAYSPFRMTIIPELRRLGPAAFALGASTELYNAALDYVFLITEDISGALDLLREMERMVIEPNKRTLFILETILERTRAIKNGQFGQAVEAIWHTERNRLSLKELGTHAQRLSDAFSAQDKDEVAKAIREQRSSGRRFAMSEFPTAEDSSASEMDLLTSTT